MRWLLLVVMLAIPAAANAQKPGMNARRQALQGQIIQKFMQRVSQELGLDAATRGRLEQQMRQSGEQRRSLAESTGTLRRRMMDATMDSTTSDADLRKLLAETTALRQKEEDLWKEDQEALARILTPRQQVRFIFLWLRFNEQIREAALRPPPRFGPRP